MNPYPHIAARLFNTPLLIHPGKLHAIVAGLSGRLGVTPTPNAYAAPTATRDPGGYRVIENGTAILDIFGVLAHRGGITADSSYILGYQTVALFLANALNDPNVRAILLNIDSPGGEVSGVYQLADQIYQARSIKPIVAVASDLAASAAYLLASAAQTVSVTPTAVVGSIGVVTCHADFSCALDKEGIAVTLIHAGAHKVDGNPYQPLPAAVAEQLQADVDLYYGQFLDAVATYRPGITREALRETEARTYIGAQALTAGLADHIETPDQAIARLEQQFSSSPSQRSSAMFFNKKRLNLDVSLSDPESDPAKPTEPTEPKESTEPTEPEEPALSALAIVQQCNAAGEPRVAELALKTPHTQAQLNQRLAQAATVRKVCARAHLSDLADGLIAHGADEEAAKMATWEALVQRDERAPVDNAPPPRGMTLNRAALNNMPPQARVDFFRAGGQLVD